MPISDMDRLSGMLRARHACVVVTTYEEEYLIDLVRQSAEQHDLHLMTWSVTAGLMNGFLDNEQPIADTSHPAAALTYLAQRPLNQTVVVMYDLAGHLADERVRRCLRELIGRFEKSGSVLILVDADDAVPPIIKSIATRLELSLPNLEELDQIFRATARELHSQQRITIQLKKEELAVLVQNLQGLTRRQARQAVIESLVDDQRIDVTDVKRIIAFKKRALRNVGVLEPVESFTNLDEIGGMQHLKKWLELRQRALDDDATEFGIEPPRGILMLGVQGAGKSLSAKAVATAWQRPLIRLDAGSLFDRYIGESERRLRDARRQAEMMSPVILWIDEIEKAFASAASQSSDGGVSKRMFGTLLTWMQEHTRAVFIIATANDVSALPPELLRKGRFDEVFFVDLPGEESRRQIIEIHLKKRQRDPELFDVNLIAAACDGYSGAEIESGIKASIYEAYSRNCLLSNEMIIHALKKSPPLSVTMREKIVALREWARGRCVPVE